MTDASGVRGFQRELFQNQLWQSLNFVAKAAFLVLLSPLMLSRWGAEQFGLFGLASSLLVSMALLDGGVRSLTRLRLAQAFAGGRVEEASRAFGEGLGTFASVLIAAGAGVTVLAWRGDLTRWFRLPAGGEWVLVLTMVLTGVLMLTLLGLEPVAARGGLSKLKAANTWGAVAAIPLVAAVVWFGGSVAVTITVYSLSMIVPNLLLAWTERLHELRPFAFLPSPRAIFRTLREGLWFYLTTVSLVIKTHALTFLVSALAGPSLAGLFYLLLRITEIVGNVGATASETSLAAMASVNSAGEKRRCFIQAWRYVALFCIHGALVLGFLGDPLLKLWLRHEETLPPGTGFALAFFGLCGAFSRVVVNTAMGLKIIRPAAIGNILEGIANLVLAAVGFHLGGLTGLLWLGGLGVVMLAGSAVMTARLCEASVPELFLTSLRGLVIGWAAAAVCLAAAGLTHSLFAWAAGLGVAGLIGVVQLRGLHRAPREASQP